MPLRLWLTLISLLILFVLSATQSVSDRNFSGASLVCVVPVTMLRWNSSRHASNQNVQYSIRVVLERNVSATCINRQLWKYWDRQTYRNRESRFCRPVSKQLAVQQGLSQQNVANLECTLVFQENRNVTDLKSIHHIFRVWTTGRLAVKTVDATTTRNGSETWEGRVIANWVRGILQPSNVRCTEGRNGLLAAVELEDTVGTSCHELYLSGFSSSGIYTLRGERGHAYKAFCDMNGGWTLILKINGRNQTFLYQSDLWTNKQEFNPDELALDDQETKLESYWQLPFIELRLGMKQEGTIKWVTVPYKANSLYAVIAEGHYHSVSVGRHQWKSLIMSSSLQQNCNKEGFNVFAGDPNHHRVRIGIIANDENDCITCDSRIGFGSTGSGCGLQESALANSCGNVAQCGDGDGGNTNISVMGYIMAR